MRVYISPDKKIQNNLVERPQLDSAELNQLVRRVFSDVQMKGDDAVASYTKKFDDIKLDKLYVGEDKINKLATMADLEVKKSIDVAYANIKKFQSRDLKVTKEKVETTPGVVCWQETRPIENVGLYVPGGSAPLISTVLMLGVPAVLAGCKNIVLCTPPNKQGSLEPALCYAIKKIGIKKVFTIGGIQAIAAMSLGTESVPRTYKIFGPGNQYVMAAKQYALKYGVAADMPAGPSEVMVIADDDARADFVAADLLSQAEHGKDSQTVLVTSSRRLVKYVRQEIVRQVESLPRKEIAKASINNSFCIVLDSEDEMVKFADQYAPEHLIINTKNPEALSKKINNAGSIFIGGFSPESAGDYASGTNHTLPTSGWAKSYSGLSARDFTRTMSLQKISQKGIKNLAVTITTIARAEGLEAHARAAEIRLYNI